ncbi:MAG: hypothetical protein ACN0LA_12010 [Candidatus Longimicrobiales bacterium M2_2A_002]
MNSGRGTPDPVHGRRPRNRHPALRVLTVTAFVATLLLAPALSTPTAAQDHRVSVTGYLGRAFYGDLADSAAADVTLESGGFYGVQAEYWFGRLGLRLHGGLGSTNVDGEPGTSFDLVAGDADLVVRFRRPRPGLFFQPYGFLGFGAIRYDLGPDTARVAGFPYESDPAVKGTFVLGIGSDFVDGPIGFRLELMDIVGFSSPLSRTDTSHFGPVSHVVLTLGLSVRTGRIELRAPTASRPPVPRQPLQPVQDTARRPQSPDTTGAPVDTVVPIEIPPPPPDTTGPPVEPPDTTSTPPVEHPDTTPVPPVEPPDTVGEPADTADTGDDDVRGRLFTVRVGWDDGDRVQAAAHDALVAVLQEAGVPVWPPEPAGEDDDPSLTYRRIAAFRNAADARTLGNHVAAEYGMSWEWVHIDRDEEIAPAAVEASATFVDGLTGGPGRDGRGGRDGGPPDGRGGDRGAGGQDGVPR